MRFNKEQLREAYKKLPDAIKDSMETSSAVIEQIAAKNHLHVDTMGLLASEIGYVSRGLVHPRDFVNNLIAYLGLSREQASAIAVDVNELIFAPIRKELMGLAIPSQTNISDRDSLLREIENPTPTPLSGRKVFDFSQKLEASAEEPITEAEPLASDVTETVSIDTAIQSSVVKSQSIIEQKASAPVSTFATETTIDPYRETVE